MKRWTAAYRQRVEARVMAAIDRAIASPWAIEDGIVGNVASFIITHDHDGMRFEWDGRVQWSPTALRAVVLAYAQGAPQDDLVWMAEAAGRLLKWVQWWDRKGGGHDQLDHVPSKRRAA